MRVMVLGGASNQLDLIRRLKSNHDEVILVDYSEWCLGKPYADVYVRQSTFDAAAVLAAAKEHKVEAVMTTGTDQPVYIAARVSEKLGLKFYADEKTALAVTNKRVMKKVFEQNGIPTTAYRLIKADFSPEELEGLRFPAVLKPVDSQGQRGVFRLQKPDEVGQYIEETLSFSREDTALIEEYYPNDELTVNGWAADGDVTTLSVVDRVTFEKQNHIGICLCHNAPTVYLKTYGDEIDALTKKIVKAFGIKNGPIYFQYFVGTDGLKVNEIAMRVGGAYESVTIPLITDIDILGLNIDFIKGRDLDLNALKAFRWREQKRYVSTQLVFFKPGRITAMTDANLIRALPYVKYFDCFYKKGDMIGTIENASARAGYFVAVGATFEDMIENVNSVFDRFAVLDEKGRNMIKKYRDYPSKYLFLDKIKNG